MCFYNNKVIRCKTIVQQVISNQVKLCLFKYSISANKNNETECMIKVMLLEFMA